MIGASVQVVIPPSLSKASLGKVVSDSHAFRPDKKMAAAEEGARRLWLYLKQFTAEHSFRPPKTIKSAADLVATTKVVIIIPAARVKSLLDAYSIQDLDLLDLRIDDFTLHVAGKLSLRQCRLLFGNWFEKLRRLPTKRTPVFTVSWDYRRRKCDTTLSGKRFSFSETKKTAIQHAIQGKPREWPIMLSATSDMEDVGCFRTETGGTCKFSSLVLQRFGSCIRRVIELYKEFEAMAASTE